MRWKPSITGGGVAARARRLIAGAPAWRSGHIAAQQGDDVALAHVNRRQELVLQVVHVGADAPAADVDDLLRPEHLTLYFVVDMSF